MGIILLTELGKIPWQLRFSPSLPSLAVLPLMPATSAMVALPSLATPMVDLATPTEAPRALLDTDTADSTRERLMLDSSDTDLPSPTTDMELPATRPEAPRDSVERERLKPRPSPLTSVDTTVPVLLT